MKLYLQELYTHILFDMYIYFHLLLIKLVFKSNIYYCISKEINYEYNLNESQKNMQKSVVNSLNDILNKEENY